MMLTSPNYWLTPDLIPLVDQQLLALGYTKTPGATHEKNNAYVYQTETDTQFLVDIRAIDWKSRLMDSILAICRKINLMPVMWFLHYNREYILANLESVSNRVPEGFPLPATPETWETEVYFNASPRSNGEAPDIVKAVEDKIYHTPEDAFVHQPNEGYVPGTFRVFKAVVKVERKQTPFPTEK